jgi:hypothetical protein
MRITMGIRASLSVMVSSFVRSDAQIPWAITGGIKGKMPAFALCFRVFD